VAKCQHTHEHSSLVLLYSGSHNSSHMATPLDESGRFMLDGVSCTLCTDAIAINGDGTLIVVAGIDGKVLLCDVTLTGTFTVRHTLTTRPSEGTAWHYARYCFARDERGEETVMVVGGVRHASTGWESGPGRVVEFATSDGRVTRVMPLPTRFSGVDGIAFRNGVVAVSDRMQRCVALFTWETQQLLRTLGETVLDMPYGISFTNDGSHLFVADATVGVLKFNVESGLCVSPGSIPEDTAPNGVHVCPDDSIVVTGMFFAFHCSDATATLSMVLHRTGQAVFSPLLGGVLMLADDGFVLYH
jgi:hypothetical protein